MPGQSVEQISELFRVEGVPTLDVGELIREEPQSAILASHVDPHASELVHRRIAERLYQMIK